MAIRKSKINIDTEERSDFDNMMNDVENEVEKQKAEDGLVNRVPELKQLSEDIDKATNTFINATLELESAIQQYSACRSQIRRCCDYYRQKGRSHQSAHRQSYGECSHKIKGVCKCQ